MVHALVGWAETGLYKTFSAGAVRRSDDLQLSACALYSFEKISPGRGGVVVFGGGRYIGAKSYTGRHAEATVTRWLERAGGKALAGTASYFRD
jgi:hypothetical protein